MIPRTQNACFVMWNSHHVWTAEKALVGQGVLL